MNLLYEFHPKLVVRTPANPVFTTFNTAYIKQLITHDNFLEAIYLSSPSLYDACIKWKNGKLNDEKDIQRLLFSLTKYTLRMSHRCTPFGLFASVGVVEWGNTTNIEINDTFKRHTRLDMYFSCAFAEKIAELPEIRYRIKYFPNSSIYYIGEEIRYIEYSFKNESRVHQVSSVENNEHINKILTIAKNGAEFDSIIPELVNNEITKDEAKAFLDQIIDSQLLVSELEPAITGKEFSFQIIEILEKINNNSKINFYTETLKDIQKKIAKIDANNINPVGHYKKIIELVKPLDIIFDESRLFQTDLLRVTSKENKIDESNKNDLLQTIILLTSLKKSTEKSNLSKFAERYYERYEDKEMPLQIVLDAELGIGYIENTVSDFAPLIEGIALPESKNKEQTIIWDESQDFLFKKLIQANEQKLFEVELFENELVIDDNVLEHLPPSFSIMFRLLNNNDILLETVGGSSGVNLLGRFAHLGSEINKIATEIAEIEQMYNDDVVFAEIVHLPESRTGNVLLHPTFRNYEIPFLAKSSLGKENQIELSDLYISVRNKHIYLRSKRLNKIIIPRLSNAHNYSNKSLPIYQFLCDLQNQGKISNIGFNWGAMANKFKFLPRVRIKNVIVQLATWQFEAKDFENIIKNKNSESIFNDFKTFCYHWKIPQSFVLSEGDNELLIDCENELLVKLFINTISNRTEIVLEEVLSTCQKIKNKKNEFYSNQFVASVIRKTSSFDGQKVKIPLPSTGQRSFSIGTEWLYFKIYCGSKTADSVLLNAIKPLIEECNELGIIEKWFFIRYDDPNFHIRLRFKLVNIDKIGELTAIFKNYISPFEQNGLVYKIQTDTYNRELERYGSETIDFAESLFCEDSISVLKFLDITIGDDREGLRWIFAIKSVDFLLGAFNFTREQKLNIIGECKESFAKEFKMNKELKIQLDQKYRNFRKNLKLFEEINPDMINILQGRNNAVSEDLENLSTQCTTKEIESLTKSYIHMAINRVLSSDFRLQEMVIYDFLFKELKSESAIFLTKEK